MASYKPPLNLLHKLHAILVSDAVCLWHFCQPAPGIRPFHVWDVVTDEEGNRREVEPSTSFDDFAEAINFAYDKIDPLRKDITSVPIPGEMVNEPINRAAMGPNDAVLTQPIRCYMTDAGPAYEFGMPERVIAGKAVTQQEWDAFLAAHNLTV